MAGNTMRYNFFFLRGVIHTKVSLNIRLPVTSCTCKYQYTLWARQRAATRPAGRSQIVLLLFQVTPANA